jgi:ParB family chromosome partitioning protein
MTEIISVDPFRCRMWSYHDRMEQHIDENNCQAEIVSFQKFGQLVPALGRRLRGDPTYEVELICGARRRFVAMHLNKPLAVDVRQMSDMDAIIAMDIENRHRTDISPYERGLSYRTYLQNDVFKSQDEIARKLNISPSQISRLLKLAHLPSVIISAFRSPRDICETWALELASVLEDPQRRTATYARARAIAAMEVRPPAREILRQLVTASVPGGKVKLARHDKVVSDRRGKPLFRVRHLSNKIAVIVPARLMPANRLAQLQSAVAQVLEEEEEISRQPAG